MYIVYTVKSLSYWIDSIHNYKKQHNSGVDRGVVKLG